MIKAGVLSNEHSKQSEKDMAMDQYLLIPFLVGWTSIYQLFWCSPGVQGFDTLPYVFFWPYFSTFFFAYLLHLTNLMMLYMILQFVGNICFWVNGNPGIGAGLEVKWGFERVTGSWTALTLTLRCQVCPNLRASIHVLNRCSSRTYAYICIYTVCIHIYIYINISLQSG